MCAAETHLVARYMATTSVHLSAARVHHRLPCLVDTTIVWIVLQGLQSLSLAMPKEGIAPLADLTALTCLHLRHPAQPRPPPPRPPCTLGMVWTNMANALTLHYLLNTDRAIGDASIHALTALLGAAAPIAVVYVARAAVLPPVQPPPPPGAPTLAALARLTRLEVLDLRGCTAAAAAEWQPALSPLKRLRRLDVRNSTFAALGALRGMPKLRHVYVARSGVQSAQELRKQSRLGPQVRVHFSVYQPT